MNRSDYLLLVVDDEDATRRSLADILRLEGYQVQTAPSGENAISMLQNVEFDLILLDLKMPGVDGLEVLRFVTRTWPDTQVILLTAHGSLESAIEALRYGAGDYLLKPSSPDQIMNSVEKGLKARADLKRRTNLLEHLEQSIQLLKSAHTSGGAAPVQADYSFSNGVMVNLAKREIWQGDTVVKLTPTEGKLMQVFLENYKKVFTHRQLVLLVQGYEITDWEAPEVLRPVISRLRQKLKVFPGGFHWISSVRGTGYVFELSESD